MSACFSMLPRGQVLTGKVASIEFTICRVLNILLESTCPGFSTGVNIIAQNYIGYVIWKYASTRAVAQESCCDALPNMLSHVTCTSITNTWSQAAIVVSLNF